MISDGAIRDSWSVDRLPALRTPSDCLTPRPSHVTNLYRNASDTITADLGARTPIVPKVDRLATVLVREAQRVAGLVPDDADELRIRGIHGEAVEVIVGSFAGMDSTSVPR